MNHIKSRKDFGNHMAGTNFEYQQDDIIVKLKEILYILEDLGIHSVGKPNIELKKQDNGIFILLEKDGVLEYANSQTLTQLEEFAEFMERTEVILSEYNFKIELITPYPYLVYRINAI